MPKFNLEGRSSVPDVDLRDAYQAVDPFDAESVQRRQDWLDYINTRPRMDGAGNVHEPGTRRFMSVDMKDDGNQRHYNDIYNATLHEGSRENMGVLSLARLANEAYLRGDKTMLSDLESEIVDKLADLQKEYNLSQESVDARMDKLQSIVYAGTPVGEKKSAINTDPEAEGASGAGNSGLDPDVVKRQPISAREVAKRLNAEGKEFLLEELDKALDDQENGGEEDNFSDREKLLLSEVEELRKENEKLKTQLEDIKNLLDQQADKSLKAKLVNIFRRKSPEKGDKLSWRNRLKKIGAGTLAAASLIGVAWGVNGLNGDVEAAPQQATATTEEVGSAQSLNPLDFDLAESGESETETVRGYDLSNTHEYYKDGGRESLWAYGPALPTDKDGLVRELSTRVENDPTLAAAWDSTCFAENMSTEEAQACIDLFHTDANAWKESGEKLKQLLNDPNTTFDFFDLTGSPILSSYINDDGKYGELLTNDITSGGTGVHIVNKAMGIDFYMRTNCGGQVFKFIEGGSTPTLPGIYTSETPPPPNTDKPSVPVTPPTPPNIDVPPAEVLEQKDPTVDINVNEELPEQVQMGDQAGTITVDPSKGSETKPAEQPGDTYTPPAQQPTEQQTAPEAQPTQPEQRQEQVSQGVETGGGKTTAPEQAPVNNGTVDPNAAGNQKGKDSKK